ncbi:MAG: methyltransferase domain-containing protein [Gemmatimonadetes bacterium]|jgi:SAM-dependent methyltransferase|nr:methyltransferase domain-containing protein [Gemmatimonadota bacterium]MBT5059674.1 methyltransferase domain-containing protein [Gemmatimonadota bacterium]MBT5144873.1 methyltransferase domain-containing protein [Gemmatimonadota bacterium]MBT5586522.1 methyltransferase domain-containing protein [Gemmatimonadota bacterium]MBT5960507.1 methyltransferase domain-containing protein [Gemmatimonadota bacterium]
MTTTLPANDVSAVTESVRERYSAAAEAPEALLCCPVDYDPQYLKILPDEILEKDYGCGDPSAFAKSGDIVLDLGSGGGKICYIASQIVGAEGRVIGVDMNDDMLDLARRHQPALAATIGYDNVEFRKGRIQDLTLNRGDLETWLQSNPVGDASSLERYEAQVAAMRRDTPLIADDSVDLVLSNCVLNLVSDTEKKQLFGEIFRVLQRGGRAAISDIVADEPVPEHLKADPELWSGCISGAMEESEFLQAFVNAGFYGVEMVKRDETPWRTVEGIEFRSVTVTAWKGKQGECWDHNEAVIYRGPFRETRDDDGHVYRRGERVAVCRKTFEILTREPYAAFFEAVEPMEAVSEPTPFDCVGTAVRHPRQTKGLEYDATTDAACGPDGCC